MNFVSKKVIQISPADMLVPPMAKIKSYDKENLVQKIYVLCDTLYSCNYLDL